MGGKVAEDPAPSNNTIGALRKTRRFAEIQPILAGVCTQ